MAFILSGLMLLVVLPLTPIPTASASTLQDLEISKAIHPRVGGHYDRWDSIDPLADIQSNSAVPIQTREISVSLCPGNHTATGVCPNNANLWTRTKLLQSIGAGAAIEANWSGEQFLAYEPGVHTAIFEFSQEDLDPSNDKVIYLFHIDDPLRDVVFVDAEWNESKIRNSATDYPFSVSVDIRNWLASEAVEVGWSMYRIDAEVGRAAACFMIGVGTPNDPNLPIDTIPPRLALIVTEDGSNRTIEATSPDLNAGSSYDLIWVATHNGTANDTWSGEIGWENSSQSLAHSFTMIDLADGEWCVETRLIDRRMFVSADSNIHLLSGISTRLTLNLPNISAPTEGVYEIEPGILDAPSDPNGWNDAGPPIRMIVDDTADLWISDVRPARGGAPNLVLHEGQWLTQFPFGDRSIAVDVENRGYLPIETTVRIEALDMISQGLAYGPSECEVALTPAESHTCIFDFPLLGQYTLNASIDSTMTATDANPSDNWYEIDLSVNETVIAPYVSAPLQNAVFDSGESIQLVAGVSQMAAAPLTFEWKLNYEEPIGNGQITNITLPMGEWMLTCFVTDANNNTEVATRSVRILNRVPLEADPYLISGEAISIQGMTFEFGEPEYPPAGVIHAKAVNRGLAPLRSIDFLFSPTQVGETLELSRFEVWGNLSTILPDTVPRESLQLLRVENSSTGKLVDMESDEDEFSIFANDSFFLRVNDQVGGRYMFIGELELTNVTPAELRTEQRTGGGLTVKWNPEGDLTNPYLGGWRVFKRELFPFRWPYESASDFEQTVEMHAVADLPPLSTGWSDPEHLTAGDCASYVVVSFDIQGISDYTHGNVTGWNEVGAPSLQCGDAEPPVLNIVGLTAEVTFDSVSDRHTVTLNWTWPEFSSQEDNVSWSLYRSENLPSTVRYLDPIATGLWGEPGTYSSYSEAESAAQRGIKLGQEYHYILIPTDDVGNADHSMRDDNTVTVLVRDQFWDHHPEYLPTKGEEIRYHEDEWMNQFQKDVREPYFQQAAIFAIVLIVINMIAIPIVINRNRFAKRRIAAFAKSVSKRRTANEFADDIDDIFF